MTPAGFITAQYIITRTVSRCSLSMRSSCCMRDLLKKEESLFVYYTAITFLHVAYKTTKGSLKDEIVDVLMTACLQSNDVRRCVNARHSSVLSLS